MKILPTIFVCYFYFTVASSSVSGSCRITYLPDNTHYYGSMSQACSTTGCTVDANNNPVCPLVSTKSCNYTSFSNCPVDQFNRYGGLVSSVPDFTCASPQKCGFFRTAKSAAGRWWLVDPTNRPFFSAGLNSIYPQDSSTLINYFPNGTTQWVNTVLTVLKYTGINTLGSWSYYQDFNSAGTRVPYTVRLNLALVYAQKSKDIYDNFRTYNAIPVFNADFQAAITNYTLDIVSSGMLKTDPYLVGYFSDNELPLYPGGSAGTMTKRYLSLPSDKAGFIWVRNWLLGRHPTSGLAPNETNSTKLLSIVTAEDENDLTYQVAFFYYKATVNAIRAADPNHLHLGSRLHGSAKSNKYILRAAKDAGVDVLSFNFYCKHDPLDSFYQDANVTYSNYLEMWQGEGPGPSIITEYYTKALDASFNGKTYLNGVGEGYTVANQTERARWFEFFSTRALSVNGLVGLHWFSYIDATYTSNNQIAYSNRGLVDSNYKTYQALADSMQKIFLHISQFMK